MGAELALLAIAISIIGIWHHSCSTRLSDFEKNLPKWTSSYFSAPDQLMPIEIISRLEQRLKKVQDMDKDERIRISGFIKKYYKFINNLSIIKVMLWVAIVEVLAIFLLNLFYFKTIVSF